MNLKQTISNGDFELAYKFLFDYGKIVENKEKSFATSEKRMIVFSKGKKFYTFIRANGQIEKVITTTSETDATDKFNFIS